ncbi:thiamine phosphate synthase [Alteromonas sp. H39]|uniref:thiamine phosphate synthase n=1 Tax=Alteromonas sp. H39 TaxID=3389876 RepID=UPI0039DF5455
MTRPIVWSIAGSDSGGGAGIQADLHTMHALGVHGCTVITTVTAQNSVTTTALFPLPAAQVLSQLSCLLEDLPPVAIKLGIISNPDQLKMIARFLKNWPDDIRRPLVIWDPVLVSTQNDVLSTLTRADIAELLPEVDLITPNMAELAVLSGHRDHADVVLPQAADTLRELGVKAVLVTGVVTNDSTGRRDYLFCDSATFTLEQREVKTSHDHGTGCTLSSAIAAFAAHDYPLTDCLVLASAYVNRGLQQASALGQGPGPVAHTGWPDVLSAFPDIRLDGLPDVTPRFAPLPDPPGLYPVVDSVDWLQRLLKMGVNTLQLRIKSPPSLNVEMAICEAVALGKRFNAQVFINDHWALAIKHGAFGVHLGQEDLAEADLMAIEKAGLRLGISTHSYSEILIALKYCPSYIALGHIFPTQTKSMPSQPQGLTRLARYVKLLKPTGIPTVAIGGIGLSNVDDVVQTNPDGIAVVTAITHSNDARAAVTALNQRLGAKGRLEGNKETSGAD